MPSHPEDGFGARILLLHSGHLGDVILSASAMRRARLTKPRAEIALLTTGGAAAILRACGWFDHVRTIPESGRERVGPSFARHWLQALIFLRRFQPHIAVAMPSDPVDALLAALSAAPFRIGAVKEHNWVYSRGCLTHPLAIERYPASRALRYHAVGDAAAFAPFVGPALVPFAAPEADRQRAEAALPRTGDRPLVALLVCGSTADRRWGVDRYAAVARIVRERGARALVVTGPTEAFLHDEIAARIVKPGYATHFRDQPLLTLAAFLQRMDAVVTVDSGPGHLAAALGRPTIYLLPSIKNPGFLPPGDHVLPVDAPTVASIPVGAVLERLEPLLARAADQQR